MPTFNPPEALLRELQVQHLAALREAIERNQADPGDANSAAVERLGVSLAWLEYLLSEQGDFSRRYHYLLPEY